LLFTNILGFLRSRSSDFIVGRISGAHSLGLFNISHEISNFPTTELSAPINRAIFPGYAKISQDLNILRKSYLDVLSMLAFVALPLGVGIAATAEPLVYVALGSKWAEAIPLIQILAFAGIVEATESNSASVYLAIGKPKLLAIVHGVSTIILVPLAIWLTMEHGVWGTATAFLITALVSFPLNYSILAIHLKLKLLDFLSALWRPVLSTAIMYFVVTYYIEYFRDPTGILAYFSILISATLIGAVTYILMTLFFWISSSRPEGPEQIAFDYISTIIRKFSDNKSG
jgi:PST family polysaccharide transporter